MPATSSRISASSSTMRISSADSAPFLLMPVTWGWAHAGHAREGQTDERTAFSRRTRFILRRGVLKRDAATVVFHDLLDDGEAEAGAFGALRHIGLGQTIAILDRQANAVVDDFDGDRLG